MVNLNLEWHIVESDSLEGSPIKSNPFEVPPLEVVTKGRDAVAAYFRSFRGSERSIDEVKVMLVGDGGSGKTSLMNRLLGREFDANEKQTDGINIEDYSVSHAISALWRSCATWASNRK